MKTIKNTNSLLLSFLFILVITLINFGLISNIYSAPMQMTKFQVKFENISSASETEVPVLISPGVWALHAKNAPLFGNGQLDFGKGLEAQAEDGNPATLAQSLLGDAGIISSGIYRATNPGPIASGGVFTFSFYALPDQKLSFTSMFGQSNDVFYAPSDAGIPLFDAVGTAISGDVTSQIMLWDAGTEVNQQPGVGPDQAPRQSAPNTGATEGVAVKVVNDGFAYPAVSDSIRVTITATPGQEVKYFESALIGAEDNTDSTATGTAQYTLSDDGTELAYKITISNLVDLTMSHIHLAPRGVAGPVVAWLYPPAPPAKQIPGAFSGVLAEGTIKAENLVGLLAGKTVVDLVEKMLNGLAYTNIHTVKFPAGEIRGQIVLAEPVSPIKDFESSLNGAEDNAETRAFGTAKYHLSDDGKELSYKLNVYNIVDVTMAHIHLAPRGVAGPVIVWLYPAAPPAEQIEGTFSGVLAEGTIKAENLVGQLAGMSVSDLMKIIIDGNAYTNVHTVKYPAGEIRGQIEAAKSPTTDYTNVYSMSLPQGLNMISLPLKPITPYTARSFADALSATMVVKYDENFGRFMGFTPSATGNGFDIEGGKGYIINVTNPKTVIFTGAAWTKEPVFGAPSISGSDSAWAFIVSGSLLGDNSLSVKDGNHTVTVRNLRTNAIATETINSAGYFSAVYADLNRKAVVENQDSIEITVMDATGNIVSGPYIHKVTKDNIRNAVVNIPMKLGNLKPARSALLPNFPNPFNPETWLPYQLSSSEKVSVKIYNSAGQLVKTLDLGQKDAGVYATQSKAAYWDGKNEAGEKIASGTYFYSIKAGDFSATRKMIVEK